VAEINKTDVKLYSSQRLDDTAQGGGAMTSTEIVDGSVNNLFPDISRLDRVYGRVSMRKAFLAVITTDRATYYGAHIVITEQAADPLVGVCFFTTLNWFDIRSQAKTRVESYLAKGPIFGMSLYGNHYSGSKALRFYTAPTGPVPLINDVLVLVSSKDLNLNNRTEVTQFVRILDVSNEIRDFVVSTTGGGVPVQKKVIDITIGNSLSHDFPGLEISQATNYLNNPTAVYTSVVADSAKYYGIAPLAQAANMGSLSLRAATINTSLVPAAQSETAIVDSGIGNRATPVVQSANNTQAVTRTLAGVMTPGTRTIIGEGILPLSLSVPTISLTDNGKGDILQGSTVVGSIAYETGTILWGTTASGSSFNTSFTYMPAAPYVAFTQAEGMYIGTSNRGFVYTFYCEPTPSRGTLRIDYLSGGKWYSLWDLGNGEIRGSDPSIGSGVLSFVTGSISISLGAMPDLDSMILFFWATPVVFTNMAGQLVKHQYEFDLQDQGVVPNTFEMSWTVSADEYMVKDNGTGRLDYEKNGAGTITGVGTINYTLGKVHITDLPVTPQASRLFTIKYNSGPPIVEVFPSPERDSENRITLNLNNINAIIPHTLAIEWESTIIPPGYSTSWTHEVTHERNVVLIGKPNVFNSFKDNGSGGLLNETDTFNEWAPSVVNYTIGNGKIEFSPDRYTFARWYTTTKYLRSSYQIGNYTRNARGSYSSGSSTVQSRSVLESGKAVTVSYQVSGGGSSKEYTTLLTKKYKLNQSQDLYAIPWSFGGLLNSDRLVDRIGKIYRNVGGHLTENPEMIGSINYADRIIEITSDLYHSTTANLQLSVTHLIGKFNRDPVYNCTFRTPGSPIRPGSIQIKAALADGTIATASANFEGVITSEYITGYVNAQTGYGELTFGKWVPDNAENQAMPWYDPIFVSGANVWMPIPVAWETVLINCVVTSYLPLDENLLGLNPVRLPIDGKVPIFRDGEIILIHNTQSLTCPPGLSAGQVINVGRANLSLIELYDQDRVFVSDIHYSVNLATGDITMASPLNLAGYTQPLIAMHRIEDMVLAADVQITGHIGFISPLMHDYPPLTSYVSSVLPAGDLQSRAFNEFIQTAWTSVWSDTVIGGTPVANYDFINYPIIVDNRSSIQERFALIFQSTNTVNVVGENMGVILTASIGAEIAPLNPNTGQPYFRIAAAGWGGGWAAGNVVRFNMAGANYPMWFVRTTLQGPATENSDQYTAQIRGDSS